MNKTIWFGLGLVVLAFALNVQATYLIPYGGSYSALTYPNNPGAYMLSGSFGNNYASVNYFSPYQTISYVQETDGYGTRSSYYNFGQGSYPSYYYPSYYARYPAYYGYHTYYPYYYR
jgi:hypothetical protein